VKPTFGSRPVSATSSRGLLYVLNSDVSASGISGYYVTPWGALIPIAGSVRPTSSPTALPGQIEFDPTGSLLVVSERLTGTQGVLSTYTVGFLGRPGPAVPHASTGKGPFGIAFGHRNVMVVSNEHFPDVLTSTVSSYGVSRGGNVTPIANVPANAGGACWTVITDNGKLAYVTSPFTSDINGFRIGNDGSLTGVTPSSVVAHSDGLTLDEALSHNSRYLYVLISAGFASARVDAFAINNDGTIKLIGSSPSFEGSGSGTAAW
jgi:6-phosphogluconolactonase (cycloisomerase 2 family)